MKNFYKSPVFLLLLLVVLIGSVNLYADKIENLTQGCLKCHGEKMLPKVLPNGEKMSLYVNPKRYKKSVHGQMDCIFCHRSLDFSKHPRPIKIKSKKEYAKKVCRYCLMCHSADSLGFFHKNAVKGKVTCDVCHTAHYIKSMKQIAKETEGCIKCHGEKRLPKVLPNGEKMNLYVNPKKFAHTNHAKLGCFACHYDIYNAVRHPYPAKIKSKKAFTQKIVKRCLLCHTYRSLARYKGHAYVIKKGISCIKCHGYHEKPAFKIWKKKASTNEFCLKCHSLALTKKLPDGEVMSVQVKKEVLLHSVHKNLKCTDCHAGFSKNRHPIYNWKSKEEYLKNMAKIVCQRCHTDAQLKKNPAHYQLAKRDSCIKCHGYHNVKPIKAVAQLPVNEYCLVCHRGNLIKKMEDGEILSVQVKEDELLHSVHKNLKCTDCHKGFSKQSHPFRKFKSIAEYRKMATKICAECHSKEVALYKKGAHGMAFVNGKKDAPNCLSCHGYHQVKKLVTAKEKMEICVKCHKEAFNAFKDSIHYIAMKKGNKKAPACSDCHGAHGIKVASVADLTDNCLKCHKGVEAVHNEWLYNPPFTLTTFVKTHFKGASCAVCHAKGKKAVMVSLIKADSKQPIKVEEVAKYLGISVGAVRSQIDKNGDGVIQAKELWEFLKALNKETKVVTKGRLVMLNPNDAHKILDKTHAIGKCSVCHNVKADFKGELELINDKLQPENFALAKKALNSVYAIPTLRHFYVLTLTKINILDLLFLLAVIGGVGFGLGHLTLRIITAPIRRKRREGR